MGKNEKGEITVNVNEYRELAQRDANFRSDS